MIQMDEVILNLKSNSLPEGSITLSIDDISNLVLQSFIVYLNDLILNWAIPKFL